MSMFSLGDIIRLSLQDVNDSVFGALEEEQKRTITELYKESNEDGYIKVDDAIEIFRVNNANVVDDLEQYLSLR